MMEKSDPQMITIILLLLLLNQLYNPGFTTSKIQTADVTFPLLLHHKDTAFLWNRVITMFQLLGSSSSCLHCASCVSQYGKKQDSSLLPETDIKLECVTITIKKYVQILHISLYREQSAWKVTGESLSPCSNRFQTLPCLLPSGYYRLLPLVYNGQTNQYHPPNVQNVSSPCLPYFSVGQNEKHFPVLQTKVLLWFVCGGHWQ
jgi:hypothetical protein